MLRLRPCATGPAAVLTAVLALTGCGGHGATKHDVIARANAICSQAIRQVREVPPPSGASLPAVTRYLRRIIPIIDRETASTRALPRPATDRALLTRYVAAVTAARDQYGALIAAAQRDDRAGVAEALAALRTNPGPALAQRYGITQCTATTTRVS